MVKYIPAIWFKMTNSKITHLQFCRFFRKSVIKLLWKTAIWTILRFSVLPPLNNVEEKWEKLASSNVIGSQQSIEGEGEF